MVLQRDDRAIVLVGAFQAGQELGEELLLRHRIGAQLVHAELECQLEPGERLEAAENGWRRLEPGVAALPELGRFGAQVGEDVLLREPAGIRRAHAVDEPGAHIEPAGARAAAQILVGAADRKIRLQRCEIEWNHARMVIDVEQYERALRMCIMDELRRRLYNLPGTEQHRREYD